MKKNYYSLYALILLLGCLVLTNANAVPLKQKPEFQAFVDTMVTQYHFKRSYLQKLFQSFKPNQSTVSSIKHPFESVSWEKYKRLFLTPKRINNGVLYWQRHQKALARAEKEYGVPASIIVSIVGVESAYGKEKMKYKVLSALTTLSFYYPQRSKFFSKELREYLLLTRELQLDPWKVYGSYAGAIGLPQFMPSNYRALAVSASPKRKPDLMHDTDDVILSIGNFLKVAGWHAGEPVATPAKVIGEKYRDALFQKAEPAMTLEEIEAFGVFSKQTFAKDYPAALIRFDLMDGYEDWIVFHNFNVMRSYNTSDLYVMAVYQLSTKIKQARNAYLKTLAQHRAHRNKTHERRGHK